MLSLFLKHKKISHLLPLIGIVILFAFFAPNATHAASVPPLGCGANPWCYIEGLPFLIWWVIFYLLQIILIVILYVVGFIMDNVFLYNILLNPNIMPAVKDGWRVLRDISNGFFLLILLWLAIQIIWNVGSNNKRTIINLIIVAFLINFSLAITGAAFGFGNALAKPFRDKMGNDVAAFIVERTRLTTVDQDPNEKAANDTAAAFNKKPEECGLGPLVDPVSVKVGCVGGNAATQVMKFLGSVGGSTNKHFVIMRMTMQLGIGDIFLILVILTFGGVIGLLIARIIMMVFLGVVSPLAFLFYAIPGKPHDLFVKWKREVLNWTFIAPIFYFLFYVSLLMLDAMTGTELFKAGTGMNFAANILAFLPLVIFVAFLWLSLYVCKNMSGKIGQIAEGLGKAATAAVVTGAAAFATGGTSLALGAVGRGVGVTQERVQGGLDTLANRPILGKVTAPLTNRLRNYYANQSQNIDKMRGEYSKTPPRLLQQQLKTTLSADKKVAMAEALHSMGEFKTLDVATQDKVVGYSRRYGRQNNLLQERLDLTRQNDVPNATSDDDAKKKILNKMTSDQKSKISLTALADDATAKAVLETATRKDLETIMKTNAEMLNRLVFDFFDHNAQMLQGVMKQETLAFISSNMRLQTLRQQQNPQNQRGQNNPQNQPPPNNPTTP